MNAVEKVDAALEAWVRETGPPLSVNIEAWTHIVRQYSPEPITTAELNVAGRARWGEYWFDLSDNPVSEPF